ncbi:MAG: trigger factor [Gammaproteobacteria bacterium GWF2_41_13]|nr:MAG: trigger factor [Gammaproteobacteria bacterium GWF2_41_13]
MQQQVHVEVIDSLNRKLLIEVPAEHVDTKFQARLTELAKTAKMDGFRPGKVPVSLLKTRFGSAIREEIITDVLSKSFYQAIDDEKIALASMPTMTIKESQAGAPLKYEASFEVYPEIHLVDLTNRDVVQYQSVVDDQQLDLVLERLRKQYATWHEVDRLAQDGDKVEIDCEGKADGKVIEASKGKDMPIILGSKVMIDGFESNLIGKKARETITFSLPFPADYFDKSLAGKMADYTVTINKILESQLPPLDDAFAERMGVEEGGIEQMRNTLRQNMERELKNALHHKNKQAILDAFQSANVVELPKSLVESEVAHLQAQSKQRLQQVLGKKDVPEMPKEIFKAEAEKRVALGLLMRDFIKKHEVKPNPEKIKTLIEDMAKAYDYPEKVIEWYYADKKRLESYEMAALEDEVVEQLKKSAKFEIKSISYDDAIKADR